MEGGRDRRDLCLSAWLLAAGDMSAGPVPQTPTPLPLFHHPGLSSPQSVMDGWFGEGGGARPVSSTPRRACFIGPSLGIIVIELWRASLQTDLWQEVGTAGPSRDHSCVTLFPAPASPAAPFNPSIQLQPHNFSRPRLAYTWHLDPLHVRRHVQVRTHIHSDGKGMHLL